MAASPAPSPRRPRPGSPERPVNAGMYRGTWLLLAVPLLLAAFSVARPTPLAAPFPPRVQPRVGGNARRRARRLQPEPVPGDLDRDGGIGLVPRAARAVRH